MTNKYCMLEKIQGRGGKAGYCKLCFPDSVLPPISELHNKNSCSLYLTCQFTSPTVYSRSSSLIHAEVFQVPYSHVQCCCANLCETKVNPAV